MPRKMARKRIATTGLVEKADHANKEGFRSYHRDLKEEFLAVLMTNQMRDTFYAGAKDVSEDAINMHKEAIKQDINFYIKALAYARNLGYARLQPQIGLVNLSTQSLKEFRRAFKKVCLIPTDLKDFIDYSMAGIFRKGLGTGVKKGINNWLKLNLNEYYALKYRTELRDAIRLARPSEKYLGPEKSRIIDWIMEKENIDLKNYPQLTAFEELKVANSLGDAGNEKVSELIKTGKLPHEITTPFVRTPEHWKTLAMQMPYFALVRHLNTLRRHGCFQDAKFTDAIVKKLTNEEIILKSKMYPFRFYSAYKMVSKMTREEWYPERDYSKVKRKGNMPIPEEFVPELTENIEEGEPPKTVEEFKGPIPDVIKDAIETAFKMSFKNIPEIKGKTAIAVDKSGSMEGKYLEAAACLGLGLMMKAEKKGIIMFDDAIHVVPIYPDNPLKTIEEICNLEKGGTNLTLPVKYLLDNNLKVDNIVVISDMEEWQDEGFLDSFNKYKAKINPNVRAFLVNVAPYRDYPAPSKAENIFVIGGWSENILNYIALITTMKDQVKSIEDSS